jgi:hypothetical protein
MPWASVAVCGTGLSCDFAMACREDHHHRGLKEVLLVETAGWYPAPTPAAGHGSGPVVTPSGY